MSFGIGKRSNEYADCVMDFDASKAVWMAIAVSFAMRIAGDQAGVRELIQAEWDALHANGIVSQKPPKVINAAQERQSR